jgi:hypothetical protein
MPDRTKAGKSKSSTEEKGPDAAVEKQQTKYIDRTVAGKPWSVRQFGKKTQAWQKMSEAGDRK